MRSHFPRRYRRRLITTAAALLAVALVPTGLGNAQAAPAAADPVSPADAEVVPIQVTGDPEDRWNLVVLGDGFTAEESEEFLNSVEEHMNVMWSLEPYRSYRNYINVYAVSIPSPVSGVSCDPDLDAPIKQTPLNMRFWSGCRESGIQRLLVMDQAAAKQYAALAPGSDQVLALANSETYGGAGGSYATASAGNPLSALISPHELGHSFGKLQDEYDYYARGEDSGSYTGSEPSSVHHTLLTEDQMRDQQKKWWRWLGERSESGGTIGRFEGGMYKTKGVWRPSQHSMMKSLGFYMDQVSREQMTAGLSGAVDLVQASNAGDEAIPANGRLWLQPAHPVYHELDVRWRVGDRHLKRFDGQTSIDLARSGIRSGDTVTASVSDGTRFVRDPALQDGAKMTDEVSWTIGPNTRIIDDTAPAISLSTPNERPVAADNVLWVETSQPADRSLDVVWQLDGRRVLGRGPSLDLGDIRMPRGDHEVTAKVSGSHGPAAQRTWQIDDIPGTTTATVSEPISQDRNPDGTPHYTVREDFTLDLNSVDQQPGFVVSEFRVDGDGWYHYFGHPDDGSKPFPFTPTGTNVDDLIYGNLGTGGISVSPFAERTPGYGTHSIEYRSIDAAGNIAPAQRLTVTVVPDDEPAPGDVEASAVTDCRDGETVLSVTATNRTQRRAALTVETPFGTEEIDKVKPGRSVTVRFGTGKPMSENGEVTVTVQTKSGSAEDTAPFNRYACT